MKDKTRILAPSDNFYHFSFSRYGRLKSKFLCERYSHCIFSSCSIELTKTRNTWSLTAVPCTYLNFRDQQIKSNQCTMWLSFSKNGIRDSNQISTTAPIFLQFNYFRQNLEEIVTFTFYSFSFASNFPCKILWDNKNIDANILIFQIPFSQCWGPRRKKLFWGFFLSIKKSACVPNLKFLRHQQQVFCQ